MNATTPGLRPPGATEQPPDAHILPPHDVVHLHPSEITVEGRFRKDYGDLESLAKSINMVGLLHPVGIDRERRLVFGERRLRAVRDILQADAIACRVVDLDELHALIAERDENDLHKAFTPSERVAIADAIKERMGERRGRPTEKVGKCPPLDEGKTRDHAAKAAGFRSTDEYRRAAKVVEKGDPGLVELMDRGDVAISAAAEVAALPATEQEEAVAGGADGVKAAAKHARARRTQPLRRLGPPCRGLQLARLAIMKLEEIERGDVERERAFELLKGWLRDHDEVDHDADQEGALKESSCEPVMRKRLRKVDPAFMVNGFIVQLETACMSLSGQMERGPIESPDRESWSRRLDAVIGDLDGIADRLREADSPDGPSLEGRDLSDPSQWVVPPSVPLRTVSDAVTFANMAISQLERIPPADPEMGIAFAKVADWISRQVTPTETAPGVAN